MQDKMTIDSIIQMARLRKKLIEIGWTPPGVMDAVMGAARDVVRWDWSGNDEDCVADIERLRQAVNAV